MKHFNLIEFRCPCCKRQHMSDTFLKMIDEARDKAGVPFSITSGYRCSEHNKDVGGSPTSSHMAGKAVDIKANHSTHRFAILKALMDVGFTRIGIGSNFIHCDCDDNKVQGVTWHYYNH